MNSASPLPELGEGTCLRYQSICSSLISC